MVTKWIGRIRSLAERLRSPGGRPPGTGGAVPVLARLPGADLGRPSHYARMGGD